MACNLRTYKAKPISDCANELKFKSSVGITNGNYVAIITDKFDNQFYILFTKTVKAIIDLSVLENGFINSFAGFYFLEIYSASNLDTPINLMYNGLAYQKIELKIIDKTPIILSEYVL